MNVVKMILDFFKNIFGYPKINDNEISLLEYHPDSAEELLKDLEDAEEAKINLSKRTLLTRLYVLKQEIEVFRFDFPDEFNSFLGKIEDIENIYNSNVKESEKRITFEIDPETDGIIIGKINSLDRSIKKFIDTDVKFSILNKKLQNLIVKLNILYNISILHPKEQQKALSQVNVAENSEHLVVDDFKEAEYILRDSRLKDRIVTLISYVDYERLKIILRNSSQKPENVIRNLVVVNEFDEFDYTGSIKAFILDEISDLGEIAYLINNDDYRKSFEKTISGLLKEITYSSNLKDLLMDNNFWSEFFALESGMIEMLKQSNVDVNIAKVKLVDRMEINVSKDDIFTLPKTNAYLALTRVFGTTQDEKVLLLIKLFKNLSDSITYKEIYFLVLLFDVLSTLKSVPNSLIIYMDKYIKKYPYDSETIEKKKKLVSSNLEKEYLIVFDLDDESHKVIVDTLESLNLDFKIENNSVCLCSLYFNGLTNVCHSLQAIS